MSCHATPFSLNHALRLGAGAIAICSGLVMTSTASAEPVPSPAVPTTQEVPPPVPAAEARDTTETPSSTTPPDAETTTQDATTASQAEPAQPTTAGEASPSTTATVTPAAPPPPAANEPLALEPPAKRPGVHEHDGFFLRVSSGFAAWSERVESKESEVYGGQVIGRTTGMAQVGDLSIGGTPTRGLVVAASFQTTQLLASTFRQTDESAGAPPSELDPGLRSLLTIGPQFIWYPNELGGFNAEAGLGLAILIPSDASTVNRDDGELYAAGGAALTLGLGQQFWVTEQFSVGVRGRFQGVVVAGEDAQGVLFQHAIVVSPSVLFDVAYH